MFWLLLVLLALIVLLAVVAFLRKHFRTDKGPEPTHNFTLGDLRHLLKTEQITQDEFDRLKARIISSLKAPPKPETPPDKRPRPQ